MTTTVLPKPTVEFEFNWNSNDPSAPLAVAVDRGRYVDTAPVRVMSVKLTVFVGTDEDYVWSVQGRRLTKKGEIDQRFSYQALCWDESLPEAVRDAVLCEVATRLQAV